MKVPQPVIRFEKSYNRPHCFTESHVNFVVRMAPVNASIAYKLCGMFGVADDKVKIGVFFAGLHHCATVTSVNLLRSGIRRMASQDICSFLGKKA